MIGDKIEIEGPIDKRQFSVGERVRVFGIGEDPDPVYCIAVEVTAERLVLVECLPWEDSDDDASEPNV